MGVWSLNILFPEYLHCIKICSSKDTCLLPGVRQIPTVCAPKHLSFAAVSCPIFPVPRISTLFPSKVSSPSNWFQVPLCICARYGNVVDTDALTAALQKGLLRGAVLDVTDPEPLPAKHPLRYMENCWRLCESVSRCIVAGFATPNDHRVWALEIWSAVVSDWWIRLFLQSGKGGKECTVESVPSPVLPVCLWQFFIILLMSPLYGI